MNFGQALDILIREERKYMRRKAWKRKEAVIFKKGEEFVRPLSTAYCNTLWCADYSGQWYPSMADLCDFNDWEVGDL